MDWYPDPADQERERYWDGTQWTHNTRPVQARPAAPAPGQQAIDPRFQPVDPWQSRGPQGPVQNGSQGSTPATWGDQAQYPTAGQAPQPGNQYGQAQYGQPQYGQAQLSQAQYGQAPYGQQPGYYPVQLSSKEVTPDGVRTAGWWSRVAALILDNILLGILSGLVAFPWTRRVFHGFMQLMRDSVNAAQAGQSAPTVTPDQLGQYGITGATTVLGAVTAVLTLLYFLLMWRFRGASLGQSMLGLRVVPTGQGRAPRGLDWSRTVRRAVVFSLLTAGSNLPVVGGLLMVVGLVNYLLPLGTAKRQTLHDMAADTQVVRSR